MVGTFDFSLLVDAAVKGTIVLLAATALAMVFRRNSAAARHTIWHLAIIGVLALPLLKVVSPMKLAVLPELRSPIAAAPVQPENVGVWEGEGVSKTAPSPDKQSQAPTVTQSQTTPSTPWYIRALKWLAYAWVAVAAALLMRLALGFVLVRWFALRAYPLYEEGWSELNAELSSIMGLKRDVQLFASPHIATPMTWGIVRPVVMLPSAAEDWSTERRRVVMLHELAHIRRKDSLTHMFAQIACAVYWFHPLVWKAAARMRAEAERACDDLVLRSGTKPSVYADHLLELIRTIGGMRTPALALPMAQRSTFEGRLLAILEPHLDRTQPRPVSVAGMVLVVGLIVFPLAGLTTAKGINTDSRSKDPVVANQADKPIGEIKSAEELSAKMTDQITQQVAVANPTPPALNDFANGIGEIAAQATLSVLGELGRQLVGKTQEKPSQRIAVAPLITALRDADAEVRLEAAASLGTIEDSAAVAALSRALREDSDARVRKMAAWALGNIEEHAAVPALVHALRNDRDIEVRRTAVWALGQIEDRTAVPTLADAMNDADPKVRSMAVWALGQIADARAVPALVNALKNSDAETRRQAAWALGQIEDASAVPGLAAALRDSDAEVREQAVWALGQIESSAAVGPLSALVNDASPKTRKQVAWAFGQIEDAGAVPPLAIMVREDRDPEVRKTAAWALGQIESASAVPALSAAMKDANADVRAQAAWALGQIEARPAPKALIDALKDSDRNVRSTALWALTQIEDPAAFEALAEMLKDPDPEVRRAAAAALGRGHVDPRPMPQPKPQPRPLPNPIR